MRVILAASLICGSLLAAGCGSEADVTPAVDVGETPASAAESATGTGTPVASFVLGCGAPFTREATPATLAEVFGP